MSEEHKKKKVKIYFPLQESATLEIGEELEIEFVEDCRPCWTPEDQHLFDKHLPKGNQKRGDIWHGTAVKNGTITAGHVGHGEHCPDPHQKHVLLLRTIIVGGGG